MPKVSSHYSAEKTKKLYFENPVITKMSLFKSFNDLLPNENLKKISYRSFWDHFNANYNLGFSLPKSDVCNLCEEMKNIQKNIEVKNIDNEKLDLHKLHLAKVKMHKDLKSKYLKDKLNLCIEMNYAQNKELPKIAANQNYYLRNL